jgi:hypothetical protein
LKLLQFDNFRTNITEISNLSTKIPNSVTAAKANVHNHPISGLDSSGIILDHVIVVVLYMGIMAPGGSVFIGFLITCPLANVFLASVYNEKTGAVPDMRP